MKKREIPLTDEERKERNKIYTTRYRKSHMEKVSQINSETQKRMRRERKEYKYRIERVLGYLENCYTTDEQLVAYIIELLKGEK